MPRGWTATSWCRTELLTCQIGLLTQLDPDVAIRGVKQFSISRKIKNLRPVGRMSRRVDDSCSVAWSLAVEYRDGTTPYHSRTCGLGAELLSHSGESNAEVGDYSVAQRPVGSQQRAPSASERYRTANRLLSGCWNSPDRYRLSASYPMHRLAEFVDQPVDPEC